MGSQTPSRFDWRTKGLTASLADAITEEESFAVRLGSDRTYSRKHSRLYYLSENGNFERGGEEVVRGYVKRLLNNWEQTRQWSSHLADEVIAYILVDCCERDDVNGG